MKMKIAWLSLLILVLFTALVNIVSAGSHPDIISYWDTQQSLWKKNSDRKDAISKRSDADLERYFAAAMQSEHCADATTCMKELIARAEKAGDQKLVTVRSSELANSYIYTGDFNMARDVLQELMQKHEKNQAEKLVIARDKNNIGLIYYLWGCASQGDDRKARLALSEKFFDEAEPVLLTAGLSDALSVSQNKLALMGSLKKPEMEKKYRAIVADIHARMHLVVPDVNET